MSRLPRSQLATYTDFHICARGNNGQDLFLDSADRQRYLVLLERYLRYHRLLCFAYCLMTNHVHLLLQSPTISLLSRLIHDCHVAYVKYFNRRHGRSGQRTHVGVVIVVQVVGTPECSSQSLLV